MLPDKMIVIRSEDVYKITGTGEREGKNAATNGTLLGNSWGGTRGNYVEFRFQNPFKFKSPVAIIRYGHGNKNDVHISFLINGRKLPSGPGTDHLLKPTGGWGHTDQELVFYKVTKGITLNSGLNRLRILSEADQNYLTIDFVCIVENKEAAQIVGPKNLKLLEKAVKPWRVQFDEKTGMYHNSRIWAGMPLGGIGCGKIEYMPDGWFGNITTNSNWDHPIRYAHASFFALQVETARSTTAKVLRLANNNEFANISNVKNIDFKGLFPRAEVRYTDPALPVTMDALMVSPLVPHNTKDSAIPAATFRFRVTNTGKLPCMVKLAFSFENLVGMGGYRYFKDGNLNCDGWDDSLGNFVEPMEKGGLTGIRFATEKRFEGGHKNASGDYFLGAFRKAGIRINRYSWNSEAPTCELFDSNNAINESCRLENRSKKGLTRTLNAAGVIIAEARLAPGKTGEIDFYIGWHMPHHVTSPSQTDYGKYYVNHFHNALSAAYYLLDNRNRLVDETMVWQDLILKSSLPFWLKFRIINGNFPLYANTIFSKKGIFATIESPITMMGALGTMDQRMASHGFTSQMYTGLDRRELDSFTKCQRPDGRITHFTGNFHQVLENPDVSYGITDWPDLSCSWIMQVAKQYRFTGDTAYMKKNWPLIKKNLRWLEMQDKDGDFIPEGGNTYDYEKAPAGMFIYNASCYLGALRTSIELARAMNDKAFGRSLETRFAAAQKSVIEHLWNGSFFIKWKDHAARTENSNSFIASLAGDWLVRLIGLEATLPFPIVKKNLEYLLDRHVLKQSMVPPMEVDAKGKPAIYASYILQHDPYLGMESIYAGMADAGIEVLRRNFEAAWIKNHVGWNLPLSFNAITNRQIMLYTYMTATSAWHVFNALSGSTLDLENKALYLNPQTFAGKKTIELPLWYPGFWLWLTYNASTRQAMVKVIKVFKPGIVLTKLRKVTKEGEVIEKKLKRAFPIRLNNKLTVSV